MRIHRNQATSSEIVAAFLCVALLFAVIALFDRLFGYYALAWIVDGITTYLLAIFILPTWTVFHLRLLGRKQAAARYAGWAAAHHPFLDQKVECALKAASLFLELNQKRQAEEVADLGIALTEKFLDRLSMRSYYAMCLNIKAALALDAHHYQTAFALFYRPLRMKLELPSQNAPLYMNCASALYQLGQFGEAISCSQQSLALADPDQGEVRVSAHNIRALSLMEMGHYEEALAQTALAIEIPSSSFMRILSLIYHAWGLWLNRQITESEDMLAKLEPSLKLGNQFLYQELREVRGRIYLDQGQLNKAEEELREALGTAKTNPAALYLLAQTAQRRGETDTAQAWRERLLHSAPESFYAKRLRDAQTGVV